jgi:hypothetical protein
MAIFNRVVVVLLIGLSWIVIVLIAAAPDLSLAWTRQGLVALEQALARGASMGPAWTFGVGRAGVILVSTLLALLLLRWELRRKRTPVVKLKAPSGGEAAVTADSIARRLAWHVDQLADVISVAPRVRTRGSAVDIQLDLQTSPDVDIPMKTEEVIALTRDVVQTQMGLQVSKIKVNIEHAPYGSALRL